MFWTRFWRMGSSTIDQTCLSWSVNQMCPQYYSCQQLPKPLRHSWRSRPLGFVWKCCVPHFPNGFADHYPYEKWLFHWGYTQHFQTYPLGFGGSDLFELWLWPSKPMTWRTMKTPTIPVMMFVCTSKHYVNENDKQNNMISTMTTCHIYIYNIIINSNDDEISW